jgi:hypothetical protein
MFQKQNVRTRFSNVRMLKVASEFERAACVRQSISPEIVALAVWLFDMSIITHF